MTEQNKGRPFAEGDLVIVPKFGARTLKIIDRIKFNPNMAGLTDKDTTICLKPYGQCKPSDIKTIRKPRKGGKEARDIVAMLLRETLNVRRLIHLTHKLKSEKATYEDILCAYDDVYYGLKTAEKAKTMLGASDDS